MVDLLSSFLFSQDYYLVVLSILFLYITTIQFPTGADITFCHSPA